MLCLWAEVTRLSTLWNPATGHVLWRTRVSTRPPGKAVPVWSAQIGLTGADSQHGRFNRTQCLGWSLALRRRRQYRNRRTDVSRQSEAKGDPSDGYFRWQVCLHSGPVLGSVTAFNHLVEIGTGGGEIDVVSARTGSILFHQVLPKSQFWGPGSVSHGILLQGDLAGHLYAFAPRKSPEGAPSACPLRRPLHLNQGPRSRG